MTSATLPKELDGKVVTPADPRYRLLRSTYTTVARPALVVLPQTTTDVVAALRYARDSGLPIAVRSGGHGLSGRSSNDGGVVIDVSGLNEVRVLDRRTRLVRVGAGARWAEVARDLASAGLAISSGDHGNVGVGGLAIAGGVGWLVRDYGLTIDHVRAAEVVLADGRVVRTDAEHEPDLFWAVRGAGAGVGVVTAFEIEATELRDIAVAQLTLAADPDGSTLSRWAEHLAQAPRRLSTAAMLMSDGRRAVLSLTAVYAGPDTGRMRKAVAPLLEIGTLLDQRAHRVPYSGLVSTAHLHPNLGQQPANTTNGLLPTMTPDAARAITAAVTGPRPALLQLRSVGGAVNDVAADATAYSHRDSDVLVVGTVFPPGDRATLDRIWRPVGAHTRGAYANFESCPDAAAFRRFYPGPTGDRVLATWRHHDPDGIFRSALYPSELS
ncbi:FAD-binding oxidoreductase [Paractinoplanes hotanensis]|uniref:FAD-binding oxidoreductase n=1 Tax=Paractinoplanes hotanensis TaxID=2906497 RepID=A0ABT0YET8_9ACTN|nr:FAD-binding oxidoreductase [Actinoplanes hotanensis]MCM4084315.1 FAD-binding oxidoreductase [Actinoplanes hotanensis]